MKKIQFVLFITILSFLPLNIVRADEGVLYSPRSCFGKVYGIHNNHWHEAIQKGNEYIAVGDPINSYPCVPSNDPTLKALTINGNNIDVSDTMEFTTYDEKVNISATPNYQYAKIEYEHTKNLQIGNNLVPIKITGAAGLSKTYELTIIRKKVLSTNNNIKKIIINGKEYKLKKNTIKDLFVTSNQTKLDIKVIKEDETAQITIKNNNLKAGDNTITILSKAENGDVKKYYIKLHKSMVITDILGFILGILILLSPILIIIFIIRKKNKKKYINNTHRYKKYKKLK